MCLGIPAQIAEVHDDDAELATVDLAGVRRVVNIALVLDDGPVEPGDWVLLHAGFALDRLDENEAAATIDLLEQMGQAYEDEIAALRESGGP